MEKHQIDILDMGLAVENHFADNASIWNANVPITAAKATLTSKLSAITTQHAIQLINITGITLDKDAAETILENQAFVVSSAMSTYATSIGNSDLYDRVHYSASRLKKEFRDAELIGICFNLHKDATDVAAATIAPYGIVPAILTNLNTAISNFSAIMKNPTEAIARRKAATEKIAELIADLTHFLETMLDNAVVALTATQPAFVEIYNNVRAINDSPTHALSLTTTCVDSATHLPVQGVVLLIEDDGSERVSGISGFNTYHNISEGVHNLKVTHPNYEEQNISFTIVQGQTTELIIALVGL